MNDNLQFTGNPLEASKNNIPMCSKLVRNIASYSMFPFLSVAGGDNVSIHCALKVHPGFDNPTFRV